MSGLYLLALIAIWLLVGWGIFRFWKHWQSKVFSQKALRIGIGILLFSIWSGGAFWQAAGKKMYWDARVRKMCEVDGGIKVYKKVELPSEMFDKWGMVKFYLPTQNENALGSDYLLKRSETVLWKNGPIVARLQYRILHRSSEKILGETTLYTRSGGDLPGPWEGSWSACPSTRNAGLNKLIKTVFIDQTGGE